MGDLIAARLTAEQARTLTGRIRSALDELLPLIREAYERRADLALGYESWQAYCAAELGGVRVPLADRPAAVAELRGAGLSTRAIGSALGVNQSTVVRDLRSSDADASVQPEHVTSLDGRQRPAVRHPRAEFTEPTTDLRDQVLAQLPTDSGQALTSTDVWAELTGCSMQQVGDVLADLERDGLARSPGMQRGRGRLWYRASVEECDAHPDVDDDQDELAGLGEDYEPDPQRRIEAVATVAPEFVRPVDATESPARQDPDPISRPSVATAGGPVTTTPAGPTFAEVLDRLVPDDNPNGEWRRNFVKAIGGANRLMLFTPDAVAEKADQQCLDELARLAEHFADWRSRIGQAVAAATPDNVRPLRRIS